MTASVITRSDPVPSQYSKTVTHAGTIYLAGLIAQNWDLDIAGQAREIFAEIDALLAQSGADKRQLLTVQAYLQSFDDYSAFKHAYAAWIDPDHLPARATVCAVLLDAKLKLEIVATAARPDASAPGARSAAERVAAARAVIANLAVEDALKLIGSPDHTFVDVREDNELATGRIPNSVHVPRGNLEFALDKTSDAHRSELGQGQTLIMVCGSGGRAALAAELAHSLGYRVLCLENGMRGWKGAGAPLE
jgi:enamine deaminase RidA (YjgF/YER057c/UK114 family)/rhodanese-related sulfurtransferase